MMAGFTFRLQTLLKLCEQVRDERRAMLADAYAAERIVIQQAAQLVGEIESSRNRARQLMEPGQVNVDTLLNSNRYGLVLEARRQQLAQQNEQLAGEIERRRQLLVEADRQVQVLEKLRDKKMDEHQRRQLMLEIKQFDEIAGQRHHTGATHG